MILSKAKRRTVREKTQNRCWYCGDDLSGGKMTIDHVTPRVLGGPVKDVDNLVPACDPCNQGKGMLTLDEYRESLGGIPFYGEIIT